MQRKISPILLAALWAFSSVNGISVLCIDDEGTVSVEASFLSKCVCAETAAGESESAEFTASGKHCRDIPVAITALAKTQTRFNVFVQPAASPQFHLPEALLIQQAFDRHLLRTDPPPAPLRSIVLLI